MDSQDNFDIDPEEVVRQANNGSSYDTVVVQSPSHLESSMEKDPNAALQYAEGEFSHRVLSNEPSLDSFEEFNDAVFEEAIQHAQGSFTHQKAFHEQHIGSPQYVGDTIFDEDIENVGNIDEQGNSLLSKYMERSEQMDDSVPCKVTVHAQGGDDHHATYDEHFMDSLDDNFFQEAMHTEQDSQLSDQQLMSALEDPGSQQVMQGTRGYIGHQASIHQADMHALTLPAIEEIVQCSHDSFCPHTTADELDTESPVDKAFSEAMQYAYGNDLTTDYLLNSFSITHILGPLVQSTVPSTKKDGFTDYSHLPDAEIPNPVVLDSSSALTMTPRALRLIAEARFIESEEVVHSLTEEVCNHGKCKFKKIEVPILRTDNDKDMKAFKKQSLAYSTGLLNSIKKHRLPLFPQNIGEGEGMELSLKAQAETETMMKSSEAEKLSVTRDTLTFLVNQLKDEYTTEDMMRYLIDAIKYEKAPGIEKMTPPVSPKLLPEHTVPAFDPALLPIASDDSSSLLSDNFRAIEDLMLGDHMDGWSADTSPIREFLEDTFTLPDQDALSGGLRQSLEDMRVEVPLMLDQISQHSGPSGAEAFNAIVEAQMELDPEFERAVLHDFSDDNLNEQLQDAADATMRSVEQEQLQAVDAVGRVPIPVMDFFFPEPEWKNLCGRRTSGVAILKWIQAGKEQLFKPPSWPLDRAAVSKMVWSPLTPKAGNVPENENLDGGETLLKKFLDLPSRNEITTSLDCVHYRISPLVTLYDDDDEDMNMQLAREQEPVDLLNLVRKRSMDAYAGGTPKRPRHTIKQTPVNQTTNRIGRSLLPGDSPGTCGNLLANFMEVHAPKKRTWAHSKYFASPQTDTASLPTTALPSTEQDNVQPSKQSKVGFKAPCPAIEPPAAALTVFISIKILRCMIRALEGLIPNVTLLERDYDFHNTFIWKPGSVGRTEVVPTLADDADITVSPSTGLIVTSMIRVRQKPRAGTNKGMVQIRVEKASLRYERLIVLVGGDGGSDDIVDVMSSSDSTALLELYGFTSGLDRNVQVYYVGGGEKTLAKWVAACICRYGLAEPQIVGSLLEPETLWEVFLRRAGFNVFAAQAVASQFKPPSNETDTVRSAQCGLGAFMTMTRDERMRRFGQLVGPRVLERVSKNVDELWNRG